MQLELGWNVQPWVGALLWEHTLMDVGLWQRLMGGKSEVFDFPAIGAKGMPKKKDLETEKGHEGHRLEAGGEVPRRKPA